ncbi:DoxX family membrane protein [Paenibacillus sp. FSL W8-1187]|uniref:DoxX family membrane protein n=1 Tax=Paenibacillus sp. FSL W8-1187 TaxID=2975339 RepID=UPI0030D98B01
MAFRWWRTNLAAAAALLLLRLYAGWSWTRSGWGKLTGDEAFSAGGFVRHAIANPVLRSGTNEALYPTYVSFLKHFVSPQLGLFSLLVSWGELLVGLSLLLGLFTTAGAFFGLVMNFSFLFAGALSLNPWLILIGFLLVTGGRNAGRFGLDALVLPRLAALRPGKSRSAAAAASGPAP